MTTPKTAWATEASEELRPYAVTHGRTRPTQPVDISSYVRTRAQAGHTTDLDEEQQQVVAGCRGAPVAVVELAGRTGLPLQVVKVVVSDLIDTGFLVMAMPATADQPSVALLERVIERLQKIA